MRKILLSIIILMFISYEVVASDLKCDPGRQLEKSLINPEYKNITILVHGLGGSASSWSQESINVLSEELKSNIYLFNYNTKFVGQDVDNHSSVVKQFELSLKCFSRPVNVIAHSQGGVIVFKYIGERAIKNKNSNIAKAVFLGSPLFGSKKIIEDSFLFRNGSKQVKDLSLFNNELLLMHSKVNDNQSSRFFPKVLSIIGTKDEYVSKESSYLNYTFSNNYQVDLNHSELKLFDKHAALLSVVKRFIDGNKIEDNVDNLRNLLLFKIFKDTGGLFSYRGSKVSEQIEAEFVDTDVFKPINKSEITDHGVRLYNAIFIDSVRVLEDDQSSEDEKQLAMKSLNSLESCNKQERTPSSHYIFTRKKADFEQKDEVSRIRYDYTWGKYSDCVPWYLDIYNMSDSDIMQKLGELGYESIRKPLKNVTLRTSGSVLIDGEKIVSHGIRNKSGLFEPDNIRINNYSSIFDLKEGYYNLDLGKLFYDIVNEVKKNLIQNNIIVNPKFKLEMFKTSSGSITLKVGKGINVISIGKNKLTNDGLYYQSAENKEIYARAKSLIYDDVSKSVLGITQAGYDANYAVKSIDDFSKIIASPSLILDNVSWVTPYHLNVLAKAQKYEVVSLGLNELDNTILYSIRRFNTKYFILPFVNTLTEKQARVLLKDKSTIYIFPRLEYSNTVEKILNKKEEQFVFYNGKVKKVYESYYEPKHSYSILMSNPYIKEKIHRTFNNNIRYNFFYLE